jgi:hypothetical protein
VTKRLIGGSLAAIVAMAIATASASADPNDSTCTGVAPTTVNHDLIVPAGGSCTINFGSTIGHDVIVNSGAQLFDRGATVGHDITASQPQGVLINGGGPAGPGHVGHDIKVDGVSGQFGIVPFNSVCNNFVGHDVVIQSSLATAAPWKIGTPGQSFCTSGADRVGHDIVIRNNANNVDVSNNAPATLGDVGHDLTIVGNSGGVTANGNHAGHDCSQSNNHPYSGSGNTADHSVDSCNSSNS